jgi:peroxiredoxin family protein
MAFSTAATVCIFFSRPEYEQMHLGLSIAAAATAQLKSVELYFFWWALDRLVRGNLDEPDTFREDVNTTMELRQIPTLRQLLTVVRDSQRSTVFACSGSLQSLGLIPPQVEPHVDSLIGLSAILQRTTGIIDRFQC